MKPVNEHRTRKAKQTDCDKLETLTEHRVQEEDVSRCDIRWELGRRRRALIKLKLCIMELEDVLLNRRALAMPFLRPVQKSSILSAHCTTPYDNMIPGNRR
jgi:hypothetical protein